MYYTVEHIKHKRHTVCIGKQSIRISIHTSLVHIWLFSMADNKPFWFLNRIFIEAMDTNEKKRGKKTILSK